MSELHLYTDGLSFCSVLLLILTQLLGIKIVVQIPVLNISNGYCKKISI